MARRKDKEKQKETHLEKTRKRVAGARVRLSLRRRISWRKTLYGNSDAARKTGFHLSTIFKLFAFRQFSARVATPH